MAWCLVNYRDFTLYIWMSSVTWNLRPFKSDFIFGNSHESVRVKSGEEGGVPFSVINFWTRNCLTKSALWGGVLLWWRVQSSDQSSCHFIRTASR